MLAPRYIQEELKMINPYYFAVFNPYVKGGMSRGRARWQVRKWKSFPRKAELWNEDDTELIFTICHEEMTDDGLIDAGYQSLDMRVVQAIRKSNYWKNQWKKNIQELDWRNERKRRQADAELEYQSKYAAKRIWRHLHEPTVHQSGKWDYYKGE